MFNTIQSMWYVQSVSEKISAWIRNSGPRESIYCIVNKDKSHKIQAGIKQTGDKVKTLSELLSIALSIKLNHT